MKNIVLILAGLSLAFSSNSCKKKSKETSVPIELRFNVPFSNEKSFDVIDSQIVIETFEFETAFDAAFTEKKSSKDKLEFATVDKMELTIVLPQTESFDVLKDMEVYLAADGLPDLFCSYTYNVPSTGLKTLTLETTGKDASEYIKKPAVKMILKMVLRKPLNKGTVISIRSSFKGTTGLL